MRLAHVGELHGPMVYLVDSRKAKPVPDEAIDVARSVKFDAMHHELGAAPRTSSYGALSPIQRAAYVRWIASGRREPPGLEAFAWNFISGLERRSLLDGQSVGEVFDELLALVPALRAHPLLRDRCHLLAWFLLSRHPQSIDAAQVGQLICSTKEWGDAALGSLLAWHAARQLAIDVLVACIAAEAHANARPVDPRSALYAACLRQFQADFTTQLGGRFSFQSRGLRDARSYEPINAALSKHTCAIDNPWLDVDQFRPLAMLWNRAAAHQLAPAVPTPSSAIKVEVVAPAAPPPLPRAAQSPTAVAPPRGVMETIKAIAAPIVSPAPRRVVRQLTWLGSGTTLEVPAVGTLIDPLIYAASIPSEEPAAVRLDLPIHAQPSSTSLAMGLPYWPRYDGLSMFQRRYYVDWLRSGRRESPIELGYTFLFIYGLERRALIDRADVPLVIDEVLRLRAMYEAPGEKVSRSLSSYTDQFLWMLALRERAWVDGARLAAIRRATTSWNEDLLGMMLALAALEERPLDVDSAVLVARESPESMGGVVVRRAGGQLHELFKTRYTEKFGDGLPLRLPKREKRFTYRPASAPLPPIDCVAVNPLGLSSQFRCVVELWNGCVEDLRRFSATQKTPTKSLTAEAWAALPPELREETDHPLEAALAALAAENAEPSGQIHVPAARVAKAVGVAAPARITPASARRIAQTLDDAGQHVEPDPRLTGRGWDADEPLSLFRRSTHSEFEPGRYALASCMLSVGMALASLDGDTAEDEMSTLTQQIRGALELSEAEERRLSALRGLLMKRGVDLSEAAKLLKKLDSTRRELMSKLILAMVVADGLVTPDELKAVKKLFNSLGFGKGEVDASIDRLKQKPADAEDEPVTVAEGVAERPGEAIPPQQKSGATEPVIRLDRAAIAVLLQESREASVMLAEAMNLEVEPVVEKTTQSTSLTDAAAVDPSLPARYAAFYQVLVSRPEWTRSDLAALAKQHNLMLSGAVDAINEWSTEQKGGPLLYDDGDTFTIETGYLN